MVTLNITEHCHIPAVFISLNIKLDGTHGHSEHIGKGKEVKAPTWIEPAVIQPGAGHFADDLK
jgi:hypothetical protein